MTSLHFLPSDDNFISTAATSVKSTMVEISNSVEDASSSSSDDRNAMISSVSISSTEHKTKPTSPVSVLSQSPASIQRSPLSSLRIDLLTKSTIYKRHEARLSRSYALRDDPRPSVIRVLSGLPGFRIIFPPYRSESEKLFHRLNEQNHKRKSSTTRVVSGKFSEETLFNRYAETVDNAVGTASTGNNDSSDYGNAFEPERIVQAMLATGFCAGSAEFIFAYGRSGNQLATSSSASPFHNVADSMTKNSNSPLFFRIKSSLASNGAGPEIYNGYAANNNAFFESPNNARPSAGAFSRALSTALPISVLFGSKVLLDSIFENRENDKTSQQNNSTYIANSILSSALAGGVVGSSRLILSQLKYGQHQSQSFQLSMINRRLAGGYSFGLIGRNVAAAILYFSVYDGISSISSTKSSKAHLDAGALSSSSTTNERNKKKGTLDIVAGGALAGIAHTAAMNSHRYAHYGSMIWWSRIMLPAFSRAGPIHALVFYGYEKMKEGVETG